MITINNTQVKLSQLSQAHFAADIERMIDAEKRSIKDFGAVRDESSFLKSLPYCEAYCQREFMRSFFNLLMDDDSPVKEGEIVMFLENFRKNFPAPSPHKKANRSLDFSFIPNFLSHYKKSAWEQVSFYDLMMLRGYKKVCTILEESYAQKLNTQSVSTLITAMHQHGIQVMDPARSMSSYDLCERYKAGYQQVKNILNFYEKIKKEVDLSAAQNCNNYRLIDFLAKSRVYGSGAEENHEDFNQKIAQHCEQLYVHLLTDQLSNGLQTISKPNAQQYNYTALDYALYAENLYFFEKIFQICEKKSKKETDQLNEMLSKKNLSTYQLKNPSTKESILTLIEKSKLSVGLDVLVRVSPIIHSERVQKKTNKI